MLHLKCRKRYVIGTIRLRVCSDKGQRRAKENRELVRTSSQGKPRAYKEKVETKKEAAEKRNAAA